MKRDIAESRKLLDKLIFKIEELSFELKTLKDKAKNDSSNTFIPTSKDLYKIINKKKKSDKKRGRKLCTKELFGRLWMKTR